MAMHSGWKRAGASNNAILVIHCDGRLASEPVRRSLARFLDVCPWPAARLRRPFPWGKLHWAAGPRATLTAPAVDHASAATPEALQALLEGELNRAIDPRREPPLRFLVVDGPGEGGTLVMTWFHPLMDPRGAENLLVHLAHLDGDDGVPADEGLWPAFAPARDARPLRERGRIARRSLHYMDTLAPVPPVSPGRALVTAGPVRFLSARFVESGSAGVRATREMPFRLALLGKAMAALWRARNLPEVPFMVPISVDLRAKGEPGPTFGNLLAFHFARFHPAATVDVPALARELRQQMADAVRDGQIEANAVAMEFLHYRPLSTMLRALPWSAHGEAFSFNCADVADFSPKLDGLLGHRVVNAYHVPAILPRPGIGVFFNRCAGVNNLVVAWVEGAVREEEAARVMESVREGMGWIRS
jgi:hypothetical protein